MRKVATIVAVLALVGCEGTLIAPTGDDGTNGFPNSGANSGTGTNAGGGNNGGSTNTANAEPGDLSGKELYDLYCSTCHGPEAAGGDTWPASIAGYTPIHDIVINGRGDMPPVPGLTDAQVSAIQEYLLSLGPDISTLSGPEVYDLRCATCHGAEGEGTMDGPQLRYEADAYSRWVVRNGRANSAYPMDMAAYTAMSDAQLNEMFDWLGSFPHPTTGEGLYDRYCANCHGPNAHGGPTGKDLAGEDRGDEDIRRGKGGTNYGSRRTYMPGWSTSQLSDAEVQLINDFITSLPGD